MRLQKYLSIAGICSRREGEQHIKAGYVRVNGKTVTMLGTCVNPDNDRVEFQGKPVKYEKKLVYIALNKPKGYVTSCMQKREKVVIDLIDIPQRVYPIGRLDKDSTGLILLTNDGNISLRLSHPSFDHEKEYEVTLAKPMSESSFQQMRDGMNIMGEKTRPAKVKPISPTRFRIVLKEGKNRQIRRMVSKLSNQVIELKRIRIATIRLKNLAEGTWRYLTEKEKSDLTRIL